MLSFVSSSAPISEYRFSLSLSSFHKDRNDSSEEREAPVSKPADGFISRQELESIQPRKAAIELTRKEGLKIRIYVRVRSIVFLPVANEEEVFLPVE